MNSPHHPRPAQICAQLLAAMAGSEGRRRRRQRDTTPDAIGIGLKRRLLEEAVRCDPGPLEFEAWVFERTLAGGGELLAMGRAVLEEWRLALASPAFRSWLEQGAPSEDASP